MRISDYSVPITEGHWTSKKRRVEKKREKEFGEGLEEERMKRHLIKHLNQRRKMTYRP